ncbi:MAG: 50S ribosomal protein L25/general stress protein Ctc, partial [Halioglobus sp.]|nr:50S ribosomal protein L25/general stress protein Ctc [Halioglobus sp.]
DQGKGASRRLRIEGKVPAIIYGGGRPPRALSFDHNKLLRQMENESFYSSVLTVKVGDKSQAAIVKDVQRHPAKPRILHIDLQRIVEDEEIRMSVPLHIVGEDKAPGVKAGGSVSKLMTEVDVICLPRFLPEYFEIDISALKVDEMLHLTDIKVPEGVTIVELSHGDDHDQPIVSIHVIKAAAVEDDAEGTPASAEVPVVGAETKGEPKGD